MSFKPWSQLTPKYRRSLERKGVTARGRATAARMSKETRKELGREGIREVQRGATIQQVRRASRAGRIAVEIHAKFTAAGIENVDVAQITKGLESVSVAQRERMRRMSVTEYQENAEIEPDDEHDENPFWYHS